MSTRPSDPPDWATDANYSSPGNPWDAQPTKVKPSAGEIGQGWIPGDGLPFDKENWIKNNQGIWLKNHDAVLFGDDFHFVDHFAGSAIDTSKWIVTNAPALTDDSANGASGSVQINASVGTTARDLHTTPLAIGTKDFRVSARIRATSFGNGNEVRFGLINSPDFVEFDSDPTGASPNWMMSLWSGALVNSGVAINASTYQILTIERYGGVYSFKIDGTEVATGTHAGFASSLPLYLKASYSTAGTPSMFVDWAKVWISGT